MVLTAPAVAKPRGVSYATAGVGPQPSLYNRWLLPMTPFAYYDKKMVTKATWPHDPPKIAGYEPDPNAGGLKYAYRKFPILSTQFRDNAALQHGKPVTIWGTAKRPYFPEAPGKRVIHFEFDDVKRTIELTPEMEEWSVTLDPMKPSSESKILKVVLTIDGAVAHERVAKNIVVGDVWYVAAPAGKVDLPAIEAVGGIVRAIQRKSKRDRNARPSRFSIAVSTTPKNRFASEWLDADHDALAGAIAHRIASKADHPVGVIFMQSVANKQQTNPPLKSWIPFHTLADVPSLAADYTILGATYPGSPSYDDNLQRYVSDWQAYWSDYIPAMIETKRVPDGSAWGVIPSRTSKGATSEATGSYNVMVHSFTPAALKGIVFIGTPEMSAGIYIDGPALQPKALCESWLKRFGGKTQTTMLMPVDLSKSIVLPAEWSDEDTSMSPYVYKPVSTPEQQGIDRPLLKVFNEILDRVYP